MVKPIIFITGPTASGKTSLAIKIALRVGGEIISADSRAIYRLADIATAKPNKSEMNKVKHWGIDIVESGEYFSVADYKIYADQKIKDITAREKIPIIVGGTGLYVDAVLFDYKFGVMADWPMRSKLQHETVESLQKICISRNIPLPENYKNKRYLIRTIEAGGIFNRTNRVPIKGAIVVGISTEKRILLDRIKQRADHIFSKKLVEETKRLATRYGWDNELMKSNAYPIIKEFIDKKITFSQAKQKFINADWHLAKRQITWLKRNNYVYWGEVEQLEEYIINNLDAVA